MTQRPRPPAGALVVTDGVTAHARADRRLLEAPADLAGECSAVVRAELQKRPRARREGKRLELRQDVDLLERAVGATDLAPEDRAGPPVDDRLADLRVAAARAGGGGRITL